MDSHTSLAGIRSTPWPIILSAAICYGTACGTLLAWTLPAPVASTSNDSLDPRLAVDDGGKAHVVWRERTDGTVFRIWYTNNAAGSFAAPAEISPADSIHAYSPVVAVDGSDVHVAWARDQTGNFEIWYRRKTPAGWGAIYNASNTSIKSLRPAIAARNGFGPAVAWDEAIYADDNYDTYFSEWKGSDFSPAVNLSSTAGGAAYGSVNVNVALAPDGTVTAVWVDRITGDYHVNTRRRVGGAWLPRQEISTLATGPTTPGIVAGADGRVHVAYEAEGAVRYQVWNGSGWTAPIALPGGLNSVVRPKIAVDESGFAYVAADAFTDASNHRDIFFTTNAGGAWAAWANISNTPNTFSLNADIAYDAGLLTVLWQENGDGQGGTGVYNVWYTSTPRPSSGPAGTIVGIVTDPFGARVAGTLITAGGYYQTITAGDGAYTLPGVPVGTYSVTADRLHYTPQTVTDIIVTNGGTTPANFTIAASPPAPVSSFAAAAAAQTITLSWTNPSSESCTGTVVRCKLTGFPTSPSDGTLVTDTTGSPGGHGVFAHPNLMPGTTYYYAAFAYFADASRYYASGITASARTRVAADFDDDGDVDLSDFSLFQMCFGGPNRPPFQPDSCRGPDLDGDADVDLSDFSVLQACFNGPNRPPACP